MKIVDRERSAYIYVERKNGRTFKSISADLGISANRVRQIYNREDWERNGLKCDHWQLHFKKHPEHEALYTAQYQRQYNKEKPEG